MDGNSFFTPFPPFGESVDGLRDLHRRVVHEIPFSVNVDPSLQVFCAERPSRFRRVEDVEPDAAAAVGDEGAYFTAAPLLFKNPDDPPIRK